MTLTIFPTTKKTSTPLTLLIQLQKTNKHQIQITKARYKSSQAVKLTFPPTVLLKGLLPLCLKLRDQRFPVSL